MMNPSQLLLVTEFVIYVLLVVDTPKTHRTFIKAEEATERLKDNN